MERINFNELPSDMKMEAIAQMATAKNMSEDECFNLVARTDYRPNSEFTFYIKGEILCVSPDKTHTA